MGSGGRWQCTTSVPVSPATTLSLSRAGQVSLVPYSQPASGGAGSYRLQKVRNIFYSSTNSQQ